MNTNRQPTEVPSGRVGRAVGQTWLQNVASGHISRTCPQCGAPVELPDHAGAVLCSFCGSTLTRRNESWIAAAAGTAVGGRGGLAEGEDTGNGSESATLRSVQCPQCAGPLGVQGGRRILTCRRCGVRVVTTCPGGFSRWFFPVRCDRLRAVGAASAWLTHYAGISGQARSAHFSEARLIWLPIWEYKTLVAGWEFGSKLRTRYELVGDEDNERLDLRLVREGVEQPSLQERRYFQAAADLDVIGAVRPHMTGREPLLPLLAGEFDRDDLVLKAEGRPEEIADRGRKAAVQPLTGALSPDMHLFTLRESLTLLFYPLWILQYEWAGRPFRIVVDGRDSRVNSASAPADVGVQKMRVWVRSGCLILGALVLAWLALRWGSIRVPALIAVALVLVAAILMVWQFRVQTEVEYHEPFSG